MGRHRRHGRHVGLGHPVSREAFVLCAGEAAAEFAATASVVAFAAVGAAAVAVAAAAVAVAAAAVASASTSWLRIRYG